MNQQMENEGAAVDSLQQQNEEEAQLNDANDQQQYNEVRHHKSWLAA